MKKLMSTLLALALLLSMGPAGALPAALATDPPGTETAAETPEVPAEAPEEPEGAETPEAPPEVPAETPEEPEEAETPDAPPEAERPEVLPDTETPEEAPEAATPEEAPEAETPQTAAEVETAEEPSGSTEQWDCVPYGGGVALTAYRGTETDLTIPAQLEFEGTTYSVVKLEDGLFRGQTALNSVTLPEGIREIGDNAFAGATGLVCIFAPESLTTIGSGAFEGCTKFNSVILKDAVETIGEDAFKGCPELVIYCGENSVAYKYATDNNIKVSIIRPSADPVFVEYEGITYYLSDGTAVATAHKAANLPSEVVIPEVVEGCQVTELRGTFKGNEDITSVSVPASVKLIGEGTFYNCSGLKSVTLRNGVATIGKEAFYGCSGLESITLPNTLTTIGESAFHGCKGLSKIDIPASVRTLGQCAFYDCDGLTEVTVPGIEAISYEAFYNCNNLAKVVLSNGTVQIDGYAFAHCYKLTSVSIPGSVTTIGNEAFYYCTGLGEIEIPEGVVTIGGYAFQNCTNLTSVTIPASMRTIEYGAFWICDSLKSVKISEGVESINGSAFAYCTSLRMLAIPLSVKSISSDSLPDNTVWLVREGSAAHTFAKEKGRLYFVWDGETTPEFDEKNGIMYLTMDGSAVAFFSDAEKLSKNVVIEGKIGECPVTELRGTFTGNWNITSVTVPESVTRIGENTFSGCSGLTKVDIRGKVTTIGDQAFYGCVSLTDVNIPSEVTTIGSSAFSSCGSLSKLALPDGVKTLGSYAFSNCSALTEVTVPGVEVISSSAFENCSGLETVILSAGTVRIESDAFAHCTKLTSVTIPDGVTAIGYRAFAYCTSLEKVTIPEGVLTIGNWAFGDCSKLRMLAIPASVQSISSESLPANAIWLVRDGSWAHTFAEKNDRVFIVWDGENEPELYDENGITYLLVGDSAIALDAFGAQVSVTIPEKVKDCTVTELQGTFSGNGNITDVTLPGSVTRIGEKTFYSCYSLKSVNIPDKVTAIGPYAFYNCKSLSAIDIPAGVRTLGRYAFSDCDGLTQVTVPGVESISYAAFYACDNLETAVLSAGTVRIEGEAFGYCRKLTAVTLPDGLTGIGYDAFEHCAGLKNVKIPNDVKTIESRAFTYCTSLESIAIPNGVDSISDSMFAYCENLRSVTIPDSVGWIGNNAFASCTSLREIALPNNLSVIYWSAFANCTSLQKLVIPSRVQTIYPDSLADNIVWIVTKDSYAHRVAAENDRLLFVLPDWENPDIAHGTGIEGKVTYSDGSPAANVDVEIFYSNGTSKEKVKTDANGAYKLTYAEVGKYTIQASDARGNAQIEHVEVRRVSVFEVFLSGSTNLLLKRSFTVSGSVSPAGTATVTLTDTDGKTITTAENVNGSYSLANIPNGSYILKAENQTGSVLCEITVYNKDLTANLVIPAASAAITGVTVRMEEGVRSPVDWAQVNVYNGDGVLVAQQRSDSAGRFSFTKLPLGDYAIAAERDLVDQTEERSFAFTGYAHTGVTENKEYNIGDIVLYKSKTGTATVSGKVTANGQTQDCKVSMTNAFGHEMAVYQTGKNGKYIFTNIPDGVYFITAVTSSKGMGSAVVTVTDGEVSGETDIRVLKSDKVAALEEESVIMGISENEAQAHADAIAEEKARYDGLSDKERQQLDQAYLKRLNLLAEKAVNYSEEVPSGVAVANGVTLVSADEISKKETVTLRLEVTKTDAGEDIVQQMIEEAVGDESTIAGYYDIKLFKNNTEITDVAKQTDTAGKLRITMDIPGDERGHERYAVVHEHMGTVTTLADQDNNPDTVTFEMDKFSRCVLIWSNVPRTRSSFLTVSPNSVVMAQGESEQLTVTWDGGGAPDGIVAESGDSAVVTASVTGSTITLTAVGTGETAVTVSVTAAGDQETDVIIVKVNGAADAADAVNTAALREAITEAENAEKDGNIRTVDDGTAPSDVEKNVRFVTRSVKDALSDAIGAAKDVLNNASSAAQDVIDKAVTDLRAAVDAFNKAIQTGSKPSGGGSETDHKTALEAAIAEARKAGDIRTEEDGTAPSDVDKGVRFVTRSVKDALSAAIAAAEAVRDNPAASEGDISKAVTDLRAAVDAFNKAIQTGSRSAGGSSDNSSPSGGSNTGGSGKPSISGVPAEKPEANGEKDSISDRFTDLGGAGMWYYEAIDFVVKNGLMNGYKKGLFGPNDNLSRAQLAQILYNKEGKPAVNGGKDFNDVQKNQWFAPAIAWASEKGIISGYGKKRFGPNDNITREQLAVMLWRYAGSPAATGRELRFADADQVSAYAMEALLWAVENGVMNGKSGGILDPRGLATRAQTAQMLKNFLEQQ